MHSEDFTSDAYSLQEWSRFPGSSAPGSCCNLFRFWSYFKCGAITFKTISQPMVLCCSFWPSATGTEDSSNYKVSFKYTEQCGKHGCNFPSSCKWTIYVECGLVFCCSTNFSGDSSTSKLIIEDLQILGKQFHWSFLLCMFIVLYNNIMKSVALPCSIFMLHHNLEGVQYYLVFFSLWCYYEVNSFLYHPQNLIVYCALDWSFTFISSCFCPGC